MTGKQPEQDRHRMFRTPLSIDGKLWERFGKVAPKGKRPELIRMFVAWYLREPGAKLPERPPRAD